MVKASFRRRQKHAAVLLLARADPIRHPYRVWVLALDFKVDLGLRIVDEVETRLHFTGNDSAGTSRRRRARARPHYPLVTAVAIPASRVRLTTIRHYTCSGSL